MATSDLSTGVLIDITDTSVNVLAHSPNSYCEEEDVLFGSTKTLDNAADIDSFDDESKFHIKGIKLLQTEKLGSEFDVTSSLKDKEPMRNVFKDGEKSQNMFINEKRVDSLFSLDSLKDMQMDEIFKEASALARRLMSLNDKSTDEKEKSLNQHDTSSSKETLHRDDIFCNISQETAPFTFTDDELSLEDACLQMSNTDLEIQDEAERKALNVTKDIVSVPLDFLENKCYEVKPTIQSDKENVPLSSEVKDTTGEQAKTLKRSGTFNMKKPSIKRQSHLKTAIVKSDQQKSVRPSSNSKATTTMKRPMSNLKSKPNSLKPQAKTLNLKYENKDLNVTNHPKRPKESNMLKSKSASKTITRGNRKPAPSSKSSVACNGVKSSNKTQTQMKHPVEKLESSTTSNDSSSFSMKSNLNSLSSKGSIPSSSMNSLHKSFSLARTYSFTSSLSSNSSDVFINKNTREISKATDITRTISYGSQNPPSSLKKLAIKSGDRKFQPVSLKYDSEIRNGKVPMRTATPPSEMMKQASYTQKIVSPVIRKAVTRSQDGSVSTPGSSSFTVADPPLAVSTPCYNEHKTFNLEEKKNSSSPTTQLNRTRVIKSCTESSNVTRPILQPPRISRLKRPAPVNK